MVNRFLFSCLCIAVLTSGTFCQNHALVVDHLGGEFVSAVSLASNGAGDLFVVDAGLHRLQKFSFDGKLLKTIGGKGWGSLEFDQPLDVCAAFPLDIFVVDQNNRRLQRFDRSLNFVQTFSDGNLTLPRGGNFYPRAATLSDLGELFVLESDARRVIKFTSQYAPDQEFGSYNAGAGSLNAPADIAISDDGLLHIADGGRIVAFDTYGNYMSAIVADTAAEISSISTFKGGILCTFPNRLSAFRNDGSLLWCIPREMTIGLPSGEAFRDGLLRGDWLILLTDRHLVFCRTREN